MLYTFGYWELDIDLDDTKNLYLENDFAKDKKLNQEFIKNLNDNQLDFFKELNIDLDKIEVDQKIYNITEEDLSKKVITRTAINFLIKGKILALPLFQKEIYSDHQISDLNMPNDIKITAKHKDLVSYELEDLHIIFKHPYFHFDDLKYKKWDSGYILGTILMIKED